MDFFSPVISVQNPVSVGKECTVTFSLGEASITNSRYIVRPVLNSGTVQILHKENNKWIFSQSVWSDFPRLDVSQTLLFTSLPNGYSQLYFEVLDNQTGVVYKTNTITVLSEEVMYDYINSVNDVLINYSKESTESNTFYPSENMYKEDVNQSAIGHPSERTFLLLFLLLLFLMLLSFIFTFKKGLNDKIH